MIILERQHCPFNLWIIYAALNRVWIVIAIPPFQPPFQGVNLLLFSVNFICINIAKALKNGDHKMKYPNQLIFSPDQF